jgi:cobalt transporter subunit CbtB
MNTTTQTIDAVEPRVKASRLGAALALFIMGAGLVFVTGFANSQVLHDAAHDTRHVTAFPCH